MKRRHCSGSYDIDLLTAVLELAACEMSVLSDKLFPSPWWGGQSPYALGAQAMRVKSPTLRAAI